MKNWGGFVEEIDTKCKWKVFYFFAFQLRRAFFLLLCFTFVDLPGIQLVCLNFLNLSSLIYLGQNQPWDNRFKNRMEMFNEWTVFQCSMLMMTFSPYVAEIEMQSFMGWAMIGTIVINSLINVMVIVFIGGRGVYLIVVKYYRLAKFKICGPEKKEEF